MDAAGSEAVCLDRVDPVEDAQRLDEGESGNQLAVESQFSFRVRGSVGHPNTRLDAEEECGSQKTLRSGRLVSEASEGPLAQSDTCLRPILVGYAFGPKKMSTMGIIMAEASKALSTVTMAVSDQYGEGNTGTYGEDKALRAIVDGHKSEEASGAAQCRLTPAVLKERSTNYAHRLISKTCREVDDEEESVASLNTQSFSSGFTEGESLGSGSGGICFSIAGTPNGDVTGIRNIVRFFQSSCSSAASFADSSITTVPMVVHRPPSSTSSAVVSGKAYAMKGGKGRMLRPVRVSFVPLDLDAPLEDQHGGNFDAILHKMTEDILSISKMSPSVLCSSDRRSALSSGQLQALERVERLSKYKQDNQACTLIDHPKNVQSLMSRSDIAHMLSACLKGVTTSGGIPVSTPRFRVIDGLQTSANIERVMDGAPFTYPLIAKPLTAAGTVESHRMVVILNKKGLSKVPPECLLQEYANHDGILFKVYVMGDIVRVFSRISLPNLPQGERDREPCTGCSGYVEFDSQRPYPKLQDFGISNTFNTADCQEDGPAKKRQKFSSLQQSWSENKARWSDLVTADEIRPVAAVLRKAFGLELFGFDIIITSSRERNSNCERKEMLVVDVNYFPSYKEVRDFPTLLAQYLARRAIEGRIRSVKQQRSNPLVNKSKPL